MTLPADPIGKVPAPDFTRVDACLWRAARSGLDGHLIDPRTLQAVRGTELVGALMDHVDRCWSNATNGMWWPQLSEALLTRGPSVRRQCAALGRGMAVADLVAGLAAETAAG
jgi:carboxylate-amine ligase